MAQLRNTPINFEDDDNLLVNRDGTDYRASAERLKRYVRERLPEEDPVTGQWFHIKNVRGGNLKIKAEGAQVQCVDVIGQAPSYEWYDKVGAYHYGHSIRVYATFEDPIEGNAWGDIGDLAREIYGDDDGSTVEGLITELGYDKYNFFGTTWDNSYDTGREDAEFLEILPTVKVNGNGVEAPNNFEYLVFVPDFYNLGQALFRADPGCTYEIGPLTNTANITHWRGFFYQEKNFVPNVQHIDVSGGTDFRDMFYQTNMGDHPELRNWNVGNGQKFERMFAECDFDADLSNWDLSNATDMREMFKQAKNFSCNGRSTSTNGLGQWRPGETADMYYLFYECESLEYDARDWTNTYFNDDRMSGSFNQLTWLTLGDGSRVQYPKSSSYYNNTPWKYYSKSQSHTGYWSASRYCANPTYGQTQEEIDLCIARKAVYQEYIDWVDERFANGTYTVWTDVRDDAAKDKWEETRDAEKALHEVDEPEETY